MSDATVSRSDVNSATFALQRAFSRFSIQHSVDKLVDYMSDKRDVGLHHFNSLIIILLVSALRVRIFYMQI